MHIFITGYCSKQNDDLKLFSMPIVSFLQLITTIKWNFYAGGYESLLVIMIILASQSAECAYTCS